MKTYPLGDLTEAQLLEVISLHEKGTRDYPWLDVSEISISSDEQIAIDQIKARLSKGNTTLMNEATIWARAIYPLLLLAEREQIEAWAEVSLAHTFGEIELSGTADGVLAYVIAGILRTPYLVTLEAKRSIEAKNPRIQFFGCYTIGDVWTFARATVNGLDNETQKPIMTVETSREYVERVEAETILKILKKIVMSHDK